MIFEQLEPVKQNQTKVFEVLYQKAKQNNNYIKFGEYNPEGGLEPLTFEIQYNELIEDKRASHCVMSHYWICEGDLMSDPCMTFIYLMDEKKLYPSSFQQDGVPSCGTLYELALETGNNEFIRADVKLEKELADFSNMWLKNIFYQQKDIYIEIPELKKFFDKEED